MQIRLYPILEIEILYQLLRQLLAISRVQSWQEIVVFLTDRVLPVELTLN